MKSQKLFLTIQSFDKGSLRRFDQFLRSPYFNQRSDVLRLYHAIRGKSNDWEAASLFSKVYPGQSFSMLQLRLVMSYLQKLADQFLALECWQRTAGAQEYNLAQTYRRKGLERHFQDTIQLARQTLSRQPLRNTDFFLQQASLLWEEARFYSAQHPEDEGYLVRLSDNADLLWLSQKLRYLCLHTAYRTRFNTAQSLQFRDLVDAMIGRADLLETPAVATWFYCLKMLESPEDQLFFSQFKQALLEHGQLFNPDEVRDLFLFAINYCIRQVNQGQADFFHDILDFYKDGLEKGYLFDQGVLSHFTYFNIVAAALHARDYDWAASFIHQYRTSLERGYRDSAYSFNLARLEFARKRYDAALNRLQHSNYHDPLLSMAAKTIALKIYYELQEWAVLDAHLEALIKYIRRKPGLGYHRNNYLNLARYTQRLIALNWNDKEEVARIREKIEQEQVLTEREWLLEQIAKKNRRSAEG